MKNYPIYIKFFYDKNNNNNVQSMTNILNIVEFKIDLYQILEDNKLIINNESPIFRIEINEEQKLIEEKIIFKGKELNAKIHFISNNNIYKTKNEKKDFCDNIMKTFKLHKRYDLDYHSFINKKNKISKKIYAIKEKIEKIPELKNKLQNFINIEKKFRKIEETKELEKCFEEINKEIEDVEKLISKKI